MYCEIGAMFSTLLHMVHTNGSIMSHIIHDNLMPIGYTELHFHFTYMSQESALGVVWNVQVSIIASELR